MKYYIQEPCVGKETDKYKPLSYMECETKKEIIKYIEKSLYYLRKKKKEIIGN